MSTLRIGPDQTFATIAAAMVVATPGDALWLQAGYNNETATITKTGMSMTGEASSTGIVLRLGVGIPSFTLFGTAPITVLDAPDGNRIVGNAGDNDIYVRNGADAVDGGLGQDRLVVDYRAATGAVTGNSTSDFAEAGGSRLVTVVDGTIEHFKVLTGSGSDTITTGAGNDYVNVASGANTVTVGQGKNVVIGGSGADTVTGLDGGNTVHAGDGANVVTTGAGKDAITTGTGADTIVSGAGNDSITLLGGADTVKAGAGTDHVTIDYSAMKTAVIGGVASGSLGAGYVGRIADQAGSLVDFEGVETFDIIGGSGADSVKTGAGDDDLRGGAGSDVFSSNGGDDLLSGDSGADRLYGGSGDDLLYGGSDGDRLSGSSGNDRLVGGTGRDLLHGGTGADTFAFKAISHSLVGRTARDTVEDFLSGTDKIDLSAIDANSARSGNQAFKFIGSADYSHAPGELRYLGGVLAGDVNGDGVSDFRVGLSGAPVLTASDFIF